MKKTLKLYIKHNHPCPSSAAQGYAVPESQISEILPKSSVLERVSQMVQKNPLQTPFEIQQTLHKELKGQNIVMPTTKEIQGKVRFIRHKYQVDEREYMKFAKNNRDELICYTNFRGALL